MATAPAGGTATTTFAVTCSAQSATSAFDAVHYLPRGRRWGPGRSAGDLGDRARRRSDRPDRAFACERRERFRSARLHRRGAAGVPGTRGPHASARRTVRGQGGVLQGPRPRLGARRELPSGGGEGAGRRPTRVAALRRSSGAGACTRGAAYPRQPNARGGRSRSGRRAGRGSGQLSALLQHWVTEQASRRPDAGALVFKDERLTYEALELASN